MLGVGIAGGASGLWPPPFALRLSLLISSSARQNAACTGRQCHHNSKQDKTSQQFHGCVLQVRAIQSIIVFYAAAGLILPLEYSLQAARDPPRRGLQQTGPGKACLYSTLVEPLRYYNRKATYDARLADRTSEAGSQAAWV